MHIRAVLHILQNRAIATANEKDQISAPIMSRFAVIDIPDYTPEEKKIIFSRFALPKILKRMSLRANIGRLRNGTESKISFSKKKK